MKEYLGIRGQSPAQSLEEWAIRAGDLMATSDKLINALKNARFDEDGVHYRCYECGAEATKEFSCGIHICSLCLDVYDYRDCEVCSGRHKRTYHLCLAYP